MYVRGYLQGSENGRVVTIGEGGEGGETFAILIRRGRYYFLSVKKKKKIHVFHFY